MKYGYIRPIELYDAVSIQKKKLNTHTKEIYIEDHPENKRRNQLDTLLDKILQANDELIVTDLCILADSTKHLADIIDVCSSKSVHIKVLNPVLSISPESEYTFEQVLDEISTFQSDVVKFRTQLGLNKAIKDGKKMGRPKRSDDNIKRAVEMYMTKEYTLDEIKEETNISRATLYRHLER